MSEQAQNIIEASAAVTSGAAKTAVGGSGALFVGKLFGLDPITAIGLLIGLGGFLISIFSFLVGWWYKWKDDKRAQEIHELNKKRMFGDCNDK
ncbi:holin [Acinetobacter courvalinii]|uniref:holin n=1 Tax=Acinetobacter courvalinii TaxID=280147 RepID=UPI00289C846C|nr:holin [Acinetobacter courvalinii]